MSDITYSDIAQATSEAMMSGFQARIAQADITELLELAKLIEATRLEKIHKCRRAMRAYA